MTTAQFIYAFFWKFFSTLIFGATYLRKEFYVSKMFGFSSEGILCPKNFECALVYRLENGSQNDVKHKNSSTAV